MAVNMYDGGSGYAGVQETQPPGSVPTTTQDNTRPFIELIILTPGGVVKLMLHGRVFVLDSGVHSNVISVAPGDATQALVSNCIFSTELTASIVLKIAPIARTLIMTTDTTDDRRELMCIQCTIQTASINDVTYIYDGKCLRGVVNGNMKQVKLTGLILQRRSGIILEAGNKIGHFSGSIKDFLLYKCMPSVVDVYRGQSCN